jgi:hypothetical protein
LISTWLARRSSGAFGEGDQVEHHVLDLGLLRRLELRLLGLVEGLDVGVARVDLGAVGRGVEALQLHLPALQQRVDRRVGQRGRRKGRARDAAEHLAAGQVLPQALREHLAGHALHAQQLAVDGAVGVADRRELRVARELALEPLVGGREVHLPRGGEEHALVQKLLERLAAQLGGVDALALRVLTAHAVEHTLVRVLPLAARDRQAICRGDRGRGAVLEARVAVDADEHERRHDQQQDAGHGQPGVVADEIEHGAGPQCSPGSGARQVRALAAERTREGKAGEFIRGRGGC